MSVDVQVHIARGLPAFSIVGLPDKAVAESRDRVRAALTSINAPLPIKKITVNLSPADLCKEGSHYDLPIAIGLMTLIGVLNIEDINNFIALGELGLDSSILPVSGILPAAFNASHLQKGIICPQKNGSEAALIANIEVLAARNLTELIEHFRDLKKIERPQINHVPKDNYVPDMRDVRGQFVARRAIEIAAAGGHNLLMIGPPGTGKSMLAKRLIGLLPPLNQDEIMEVNVISSLLSKFDGQIDCNRPFREPHSSCSVAAMVGGSKDAKPGEITLAHNGVLFLDELPEFPRAVLESLRQPLENRSVTISRANAHVTYPANFQLVAAMNPCRCGYLFEVNKSCNKAPKCGRDYQNKISGPLMDRIDIHTEVPYVNIMSSGLEDIPEDSSTIRKRVFNARRIQDQRYYGKPFKCNAELDGEALKEFTILDREGALLLTKVMNEQYISARGYSRLLRVARTIADLCSSQNIKKAHLSEALAYRSK